MLYWPFLDYSISFAIIIPRLLDAVAKNCNFTSCRRQHTSSQCKDPISTLPLCLSSKCHWYILSKQNHLQTYPHTLHLLSNLQHSPKTMGSENMMGIQTLHPPWPETPAAAWLTSKKNVEETQSIPELRNVVVYIDCDWSLRWPCDFCGGELLSCSSYMFTLGCKEWQVHATDRTWKFVSPKNAHYRAMAPTKQCHDAGDHFRINMQISAAHAPPAAAHVIGRSSQM